MGQAGRIDLVCSERTFVQSAETTINYSDSVSIADHTARPLPGISLGGGMLGRVTSRSVTLGADSILKCKRPPYSSLRHESIPLLCVCK